MSARSAFAAATRANFLASRRSPFLPLLALALGLALIVVAFPRLTAAPAQARGWLLLAEATLARTSDPGAIVPFLLQSIAASPHDVWLAPNRAELGVRAWPWLDAKARAAVAEQIRLTSMRWPDSTVEIARRAGDPGPVREALASQPAVLRQFDVRYLQQR